LTKLVVAFGNFANAPKKMILSPSFIKRECKNLNVKQNIFTGYGPTVRNCMIYCSDNTIPSTIQGLGSSHVDITVIFLMIFM